MLAVTSGLLMALSFPPLPFGALAFAALIPLLYALELVPKRPFLLIYITFFLYHAGANWWISSWQAETDPYLLASGIAVAIVHPFLFFIPFIPYRLIQRKRDSKTALWAFPFLWVSFEWLHSIGDLAYPWLALGYTQVKSIYWVQFADITGYWGVSFIIVLINVLFLRIIFAYKGTNAKRRSYKAMFFGRAAMPYTLAILGLIILPNIYGVIRNRQFNHDELMKQNKTINIGLIQPSINPWNKWESSPVEQVYKHLRISDSLAAHHKRIDAFIWSETAILLLNLSLNAGHNFGFLQDWADKYDATLISGFADLKFYKEGETPSIAAKAWQGDSTMIYDSYNSVIGINPGDSTGETQIYHKIRLTPFGERIPFMDLFAFARKWLEWGVGISSWDKGKEQIAIDIKNQKVRTKTAPVICIESIYPDFVRNYVDLGAEFITIVTNDAWYNYTFGPEQHYLIAAMRAIETRRYVARAANSGVTGFIGANGETILRAPQYESVGIAASIPLLNCKSIYVLFGEWFVFISLAVSAFAITVTFMKQK